MKCQITVFHNFVEGKCPQCHIDRYVIAQKNISIDFIPNLDTIFLIDKNKYFFEDCLEDILNCLNVSGSDSNIEENPIVYNVNESTLKLSLFFQEEVSQNDLDDQQKIVSHYKSNNWDIIDII